MREHFDRLTWFLVVCVVLAGGAARASFHQMKVVEVFPGTAAAPNAQYVVLQMWNASQNFVSGHGIQVFDASGASIGTFSFIGAVANGATQAKILIATPEAASFFNVAANLTMTASLPANGGKVCFDTIDCVAWGNYAPAEAAVGTPFNSNAAPIAGQPARGLVMGRAIVRRLDISGSASVLDSADDTNNSANDFVFGVPAPRNNAGTTGAAPASFCGNSAIEGLENCDDGNAVSDDGCSNLCIAEFCGDLVINDTDETCDDGNAISGDGCDVNCTTTGCGNGILTAGESCDPPSPGVCTASCAASGNVTLVDWTTATSGSAGPLEATLASIASPLLTGADLSGPNYTASPASPSAETIDYDTGSAWSFALSQRVGSILLYALGWRGVEGGANPVTYDFDAPFTVLSGMHGASVENAGTRLVLPGDTFYSGILQFAGPRDGVSVTVNTVSSSQQTLTFAAVPEPAGTTAVAIGALLALKLRARRGRAERQHAGLASRSIR
jgi:cysteine-rich repeat protein